jgi:SAM-dependent methyltransferase
VTPRACPICGDAAPRPLFAKDGHDIVRCGACGLVFVADDPASIDFSALYGEVYYSGGSGAVFADYVGQEALRRRHARRKLAWLRHVPPRIARRGRLLDVGCAAGFFLAEARAFYEVQGVELSAWSSAYARERLGLAVVTGPLSDAKLPPAHFHVITLWDVIEHVPEPVALLAEAARVLRPEGRVVLTTGDWGSAYAQRRGAAWHLMAPPWHLSYFDRRTLSEAARRAGLRVVAIRCEGVAGDGALARSRAGIVLSRLLGWGDIMRVTLERAP